MKKQLVNLFTIVVLITCTAVSANALTFDDIKFWAGSGDNQAAVVIDWNDGVNPESLAWGFRWNGTATGADMLQAIDAADSCLLVDGSVGTYGLMINGISYSADTSHNQVTADDWSQSWSYWTDDSSTSPEWSSSWIGASDRQLSNNSWDGWSYTSWDEYYNPVLQPGPATAATVPEPGSIAGLLVGVMSLGGYIFRKKQ